MKRSGGIAKSGTRRKPITSDDIHVSPEVAKKIFNYLSPHYKHFGPCVVFDECANDGVLGQAILNNLPDHSVLHYHDIKDDGVSGEDFKVLGSPEIIVCNPPWREKVAKAIFMKLINDLAPNGVMFFLINNVFMYQGWKRARDLHCQKFYFLPRYVFKSSGCSLLDCGVAVYHKNGIIPNSAARLDCYIDIQPDAG